MTIVTRIAPSPTGDPHVGTAYIALFNYAFAKKHGGKFILRIEDTDQVRSTRESEDMILKALRWVGLEWDEGPDVGGPSGPYRQSERSAIYAKHSEELIEKGHAFRCFCTAERLAELREKQREEGTFQGYDGHCESLSSDESARRAESESFVVRMKVPREGVCVVKDHFRGDIEFEWSTVDAQVLMKSDGLPTYHMANVVDDHLMGVTHVMRGEEWLSSAPKHLLLYEYFGWEPPTLMHLPLLRNPDKSKLSKRKNPTSIMYYERMGFLPEALLNYLGMMAWTMPDGEEKFTLAQMIENFDVDRVSLGGPVFDIEKLTWLNGRYIREDHDPAALAERLKTWMFEEEDKATRILDMVQKRIEKLSDLAPMVVHFFAGDLTLDTEELVAKDDQDELLRRMQLTLWRLEAQRDWSTEAIQELLKDTAEKLDVKLRDYLRPFFVAISGSKVSTPLFDTMSVLGPDISRARIRKAIDQLGGVSKKKTKVIEKEFQELFG